MFTATAITILTLSVGAATAVFSLLWALILRPLPVPAPYELVEVLTKDSLGRQIGLSWQQFQQLRQHQQSFSQVIGVLENGVFTLDVEGRTLPASVTGASTTFFSELGAVPVLGRLLQPSDLDLDRMTGEPVAVLGWDFWQREYRGDPSVLGRTLSAEGSALTIIGVAPPHFRGLGIIVAPDLIVPVTLVPRLLGSEASMIDGPTRWVYTTGRLKPGVTLAMARSEIAAMWPAILQAALPVTLNGAQRDDYLATRVEVETGAYGQEGGLRGRYATPLSVLLAIAGLVLVIATVNLCSLVFARMEARGHELAVRTALGAARSRLLRELGMEGAVLGVAGAAGGLLFAALASQNLSAILLRNYAVRTSFDVAPDTTIVSVAAATSVIIAVAVTVVAGWIVSGASRTKAMPGGGRTVARSSHLGRVLVGAQTALAIVLLAHASLLARSVFNIESAYSGLTSERTLMAYPGQRLGAYRGLDLDTYFPRALEAIERAPGVKAAAFITELPGSGARQLTTVNKSGTPGSIQDPGAEASYVSPGFFDTLGLTVLSGRDFTFADSSRSAHVAVLSQQLARRLFGEGRGVGEHIRMGAQPDWQSVEVIGIVSDARLFDVRGGNLSIVYAPVLQSGARANFKFLVVRAPTGTTTEIQKAVEALGVEIIPKWQTLAYVRGRAILQERVMAGIGGYFGALALALVAAGIYGLLSYVLSLRRKEIGIRMALGADARRMGGEILRDGLTVTALGLAVGLAGALGSVRWLESVLVATSPFDPISIGIACLLLVCVTTLASAWPAIRAGRVEPLTELRRD